MAALLDSGRDPRGIETRAFGRRAFVKALGGGLLLTLAAPLSGCGLTEVLDATLEGTRDFTDDADRTVTIPTAANLKRIYFTSALAQVFCFTMAPDLLSGTAIQFTPQELKYLPKGTEKLAYLGSLSDNGTINREQLMTEDVQLVFSISAIKLTDSNIADADDLQKSTDIPCVCLDGSFEKVADCYRKLGDIMGLKDRGDELGSYCEDVYNKVTAAVKKVPKGKRISLYYAEGPDGLQTEPDTSQHALVFKAAGAKNVAAVPIVEGIGMSNVSLEQVLAWDPAVIIAWSFEVRGGADEQIRQSPDWAPIKAVKDGRVYTMPNVPFAWCDRPPGVNRFLGLQWVANMLYPEYYKVDMVKVTRDFFKTMYWREITESQAKEILGNSYPPAGE